MNSKQFKMFLIEQDKTIDEMATILGFSNSYIGQLSSTEREISKNVLKKIKEKFPSEDLNRFL